MCPGSHIRRVRGVTPGRESPDVQVPDGPTVSVEVGWLRGRASLGPQHHANAAASSTASTKSSPSGERSRPAVESGSAEPVAADLTGLPPLSKVSGVAIARIGTQIARTLIGLSEVTRVRFESNGRPWNFWLMSGGVSSRPWDYELLVGLWAGNFKALP